MFLIGICAFLIFFKNPPLLQAEQKSHASQHEVKKMTFMFGGAVPLRTVQTDNKIGQKKSKRRMKRQSIPWAV